MWVRMKGGGEELRRQWKVKESANATHELGRRGEIRWKDRKGK